MKRNIKIVIIVCMLLLTLMSVSYLIFNISISNKNNNNTVNANINTESYINENMKISLSKGDIIIKEEKLSDIKGEIGLSGSITEKALNDALIKEGYILTEATSSAIYYTRTVAPNKYYIMNYNDNLAIYKSNEKCELTIEDKESDIYTSSKKFSHLREMDKTKIQNYEMEFNTKEEAEAALSELIS